MKKLSLLLLSLFLISCEKEVPVFVSQEKYDEYLEKEYASDQMAMLPREAKLVKTFSPVRGDAMIVFELDGKKYLYRRWYQGSMSSEIMCPYQE
jgi:hypothetical protein